jgi:PAS domain S-box-containing protein
LVLTDVLSDGAIFLAYVAIPVFLVLLTRKRRDMPFPWMFWMFGAFILGCGLTHLTDVLLFFWPIYWLDACLRVLTAVASWGTVLAIWPTFRLLLAWRGTRELEKILAEKEVLIREREEAQALLRASEDRFRNVAEVAPSAFVLADSGGEIVWANQAAQTTFGTSLRGLYIGSLMSPNLAEAQARALEEIKSGGREPPKARHMEGVWGVRANGTSFPAEVSIGSYRDHEGKLFFIGIIRDVTERERLRQERDRFFSISSDLLCIVGADGVILAVNDSWEKVLGWRPEEIRGRSFTELLHPDDIARTLEVYRRLAAGAGAPRRLDQADGDSLENRYRHKDGSYRWLAWTGTAVYDTHVLYAGARDITRRRDLEASIARSNDDLQQFAYIASHDLQAPLRTIASYLGLVESRVGDNVPAETRDYIRTAIAAAKKMKLLVHDILTYSRVSTRKQELAPIELREVVDAALASVENDIAETEAQVVVSAHLPRVMADALQIEQVLTNLLSNAIKFRRDGVKPVVHVSATPTSVGSTQTVWKVSVQDNGTGLDPADTRRLFQMFQRFHQPSRYAGTGIGLAICHRIIERHGGRIFLESSAPGRGSVFSFTIPGAP